MSVNWELRDLNMESLQRVEVRDWSPGGGEGASEVVPLQNRGRWNLSHAKGGVA